MRRLPVRALLAGLLVVAAGGCVGAAEDAGPGGRPRPRTPRSEAAGLLDRLPLSFRPVDGGRFVAHGAGYGVTLSAEEAVIGGGDAPSVLRMRLVGARPDATPAGQEAMATRTNLLLGDDPERWRVDVPAYARVGYRGVWEGVDVVYHGQGHRLEYDFVVAPGTRPDVIELSFEGASGLRLGPRGELVVALPGGDVSMASPVVYQADATERRPVVGAFDLRGGNRVGFRIGAYDATRPLVIDPVLDDSSFLGGNGTDSAYAVAFDDAGAVYVAGYTESADFPTDGPLQRDLAGGDGPRTDVFLAKIDPARSELLYSTYLGGKGRDVAYSIAVASDGSAYVAGETDSVDFPLARPVQKASGGGTNDGFVAKLGPQGAVLQFSTYLGGGGADSVRGVAVDQTGDAYLTGTTTSGNFPIAGAPLKNAQSRPDDSDAFVTKINAVGSAWLYSTYLGGGEEEHGLGIAVDRQGHAYVAGDTRSGDFPVASAFRATPANLQGGAGAPDAFVSKLAPTGSTLVYSTYLGGGGLDQAAAIAVDGAGHAFVTGNTGSGDFPLADAVQSARKGDSDAFVSKLAPTGSTLVYSTYLGGDGSDTATDIAVDNQGRASVTGSLTSTDLPTVDAVQTARGGGFLDGFVATLDASGSKLVRSSYLGGRDGDQGLSIAVDIDGTLAVAGLTSSPDFPIAGALQHSTGGGAGDAFVSRMGRPVATAASPADGPGRDGRVRVLIATTAALFLAAVVQSLWLRRRPATEGPGQLPTPVGLPGAVANPEDQAAWIAKADEAVRATGFPSVQVPRPPAPVPFRTRRRRTPVEDGGPPTVEVPVPDLLAGEDDEGPAEERRPAKSAREEASSAAGGALAKAPAVDLSDPDLLGGPEPETEFPSDPAWWDLLIEQEANAARLPAPVPAAPDQPPPAKTPATAAAGSATADDWAADLWAAGMVSGSPSPPAPSAPPSRPAPSPSAPATASPPPATASPPPATASPPPATASPPPATASPPPAAGPEPAPATPAPTPPALTPPPVLTPPASVLSAIPPPAQASVPPPATSSSPEPPVPIPPPAAKGASEPPAPPASATPSAPDPHGPAPDEAPRRLPAMPPLDPDAAAALVAELSMSDLLDEELPVPDRPDGEPEGLSMRDLLDEALPVPDQPPVTPPAPARAEPDPSTPPPTPPERDAVTGRPPPPPAAGARRPSFPDFDRPPAPRPLPEAAPAPAAEPDQPQADAPETPAEKRPAEEPETDAPPSRPLPEAKPGRNKPERAWPRWRSRR